MWLKYFLSWSEFSRDIQIKIHDFMWSFEYEYDETENSISLT